MVIFYKKWKKYNEFQLTKNKMDLNIRKMRNHPPSPDYTYYNYYPSNGGGGGGSVTILFQNTIILRI